jgi:5'-deoxynucleotidase YfbR-like HD superfamily hydrolase
MILGKILINSGFDKEPYYVEPMNLKEEDICIYAIANSLCKLSRFNGHYVSNDIYSVAQHSIIGARIFMDKGEIEKAKQFLIHDAAEAYFSDVPKPIKEIMPIVYEIEDHITQVIAKAFNLEFPFSQDVHEMDAYLADWELENLVKQKDVKEGKIVLLSVEQNRNMFIELAKNLNLIQ